MHAIALHHHLFYLHRCMSNPSQIDQKQSPLVLARTRGFVSKTREDVEFEHGL